MTGDFDEIFGKPAAPRATFAERVAPRQTPVVPNEGDATEIGVYKPYGFMPSGNVGQVCEVIGWVAGTEVQEGLVFEYRFLMTVHFTGQEMLRLMLPDAVVVIEGKHLEELRRKLGRHLISQIQQYNPRIWPQPPAHQPIIERIEVVRPQKTF